MRCNSVSAAHPMVKRVPGNFVYFLLTAGHCMRWDGPSAAALLFAWLLSADMHFAGSHPKSAADMLDIVVACSGLFCVDVLIFRPSESRFLLRAVVCLSNWSDTCVLHYILLAATNGASAQGVLALSIFCASALRGEISQRMKTTSRRETNEGF